MESDRVDPTKTLLVGKGLSSPISCHSDVYIELVWDLPESNQIVLYQLPQRNPRDGTRFSLIPIKLPPP